MNRNSEYNKILSYFEKLEGHLRENSNILNDLKTNDSMQVLIDNHSWIMKLNASEIKISYTLLSPDDISEANNTSSAQCLVSTDRNTFESLIEGSLNPIIAMINGKIKIKGNKRLFHKLGLIIKSMKHQDTVRQSISTNNENIRIVSAKIKGIHYKSHINHQKLVHHYVIHVTGTVNDKIIEWEVIHRFSDFIIFRKNLNQIELSYDSLSIHKPLLIISQASDVFTMSTELIILRRRRLQSFLDDIINRDYFYKEQQLKRIFIDFFTNKQSNIIHSNSSISSLYPSINMNEKYQPHSVIRCNIGSFMLFSTIMKDLNRIKAQYDSNTTIIHYQSFLLSFVMKFLLQFSLGFVFYNIWLLILHRLPYKRDHHDLISSFAISLNSTEMNSIAYIISALESTPIIDSDQLRPISSSRNNIISSDSFSWLESLKFITISMTVFPSLILVLSLSSTRFLGVIAYLLAVFTILTNPDHFSVVTHIFNLSWVINQIYKTLSCIIAMSMSMIITTISLTHYFTVVFILGHPYQSTISILIALALLIALRRYSRLLYVYLLGFSLIFLYLSLKLVCYMFRLSSSTQDQLYYYIDQLIAPIIVHQIKQLKSLFIKFAQYFGGRSDMLSVVWCEALSTLHDACEASSNNHVRRSIETAFGQTVENIFESFEWKPIASASIGQVHFAKLKQSSYYTNNEGNDKSINTTKDNSNELINVVVKVQHENIYNLMVSDLDAVLVLCRFVNYFDSRWNIMIQVLETWKKSMNDELNFQQEAINLYDIDCGFHNSQLQVLIPRPIRGLIAKEVFVMTRLNGFKITDKLGLNACNIDKEALMSQIAHSCAYQLLVLGIFNGDPHAGNLFICPKSNDILSNDCECAIGLLDFGMTIRLTAVQRLAYCRLILGLYHSDFEQAINALKEIGYATNQQSRVPERDVEFFVYLFRDSMNKQQTKQESKQFMTYREQQKKEDIETGTRENGGRNIEKIPDEFMYLTRVIGLLRGLTTELDVPCPMLQILAYNAELGMKANSV